MDTYMTAGEKKPIFFTLFKGALFFALFFCLFCLFLYAAGTRQGFTDKTQILLLYLSLNSGLVLTLCSICGVCFYFSRIFRGPRFRYILMTGVYLGLAVFGAAVSLLALFIIAAAGGNG
jgi:membrane-associated HD superfamily phosphohydrolase